MKKLISSMALFVGTMSLLSSCAKSYKIDYNVTINMTNGTVKELKGTLNAKAHDKNDIQFTLSSRFRTTPCLLLINGTEIETLTNIACGVESYTVNKLEIIDL